MVKARIASKPCWWTAGGEPDRFTILFKIFKNPKNCKKPTEDVRIFGNSDLAKGRRNVCGCLRSASGRLIQNFHIRPETSVELGSKSHNSGSRSDFVDNLVLRNSGFYPKEVPEWSRVCIICLTSRANISEKKVFFSGVLAKSGWIGMR